MGLGASYASLKLQNTQIWKPAPSARSLLFFTTKRDQNHSGHAPIIDVTSSTLPRCHGYRAVITGDDSQGAPPQPGPRAALGEGVLLGGTGAQGLRGSSGLAWPLPPRSPASREGVSAPCPTPGRRAEVGQSCRGLRCR